MASQLGGRSSAGPSGGVLWATVSTAQPRVTHLHRDHSEHSGSLRRRAVITTERHQIFKARSHWLCLIRHE
jgi:hypothetical protein